MRVNQLVQSFLFGLAHVAALGGSAFATDLSSILMRSTFKIEGPTVGGSSVGTAFVIGQPHPERSEQLFFVLITANHVLADISGEHAVIHLRSLRGESYSRLPLRIAIRSGEKQLWTRHKAVDLAAMRVSLPVEADIQLLPAGLIAGDKEIQKYEVHPGDELLVLGFPYGAESNAAGFPILRSGRIASFPLAPIASFPTFLLDFEVFKGNSGGPVFLEQTGRSYGGAFKVGTIRLIMGVVSGEARITEEVRSLDETTKKHHRLALAKVVQAGFIRELLDQLP